MNPLWKFLTSLRLCVAMLALGLVLVFWGTLAQVHLGLYQAQHEFFQSFFIYWQPQGAAWRVPIFPGGYLIGGVLIINLFCAHFRYYQPGTRKIGIAMIHLGIVLLLLGQLLTDLLSKESFMHVREGGSKNYSESTSQFELAVVDTSDTNADKVVSIPGRVLANGAPMNHPGLPFSVSAKKYFANSSGTTNEAAGREQFKATGGFARNYWWQELPRETAMNRRDIPSAHVELSSPTGGTQSFVVSGFFEDPQEFDLGGRSYQLSLRNIRHYKPFRLHLVDFRFDRYAGTETAKNFSSRVRVQHPGTGEDREVVIRMNEPLRYGGETFYQADWDKEDERGTVLQVVRNPTWLTPYIACGMVAFGMLWQFLSHLIRFASKRASP